MERMLGCGIQLLLLACSFLTAGVFAGEAPAQPQKFKLAYVSPSGAVATPWVTKEAGLFDKNGLDAELIFIRGGSTILQSLLAGDVDMVHLAGNPAMEASLAGADAVMLASVLNRPVGFYLIALPGVKNMSELRGSRVGITRFGSATDLLSRIALKQFQLSPERDVTLVQLGGIPEIAAGLKAKVVKAGFVSSPLNLSLIDMGYGVLLDFGRDMLFPFSAFTSRRAAIKQKEQLFRGAIKALAEGTKVYRTQRDFTLKVLEKYTRVTDAKALAQTYETYAPYLEKIPYVDLKGVEHVLSEIGPRHPAAKNRKPADFVDHRYVEALEQSGFFKELYR